MMSIDSSSDSSTALDSPSSAPDASTTSSSSIQHSRHTLVNTSLGVFVPENEGGAMTDGTSIVTAASSNSSGLCRLLIVRGKWNSSVGHAHSSEGCMHLFVEEMVYLLVDGCLEVIYDDLPLSRAEAYALMCETTIRGSSSSINMNGLVHPHSAYLTYSTLRTHGLIVMRPQLFHQHYSTKRYLAQQQQQHQQKKGKQQKNKNVSASSSMASTTAATSSPSASSSLNSKKRSFDSINSLPAPSPSALLTFAKSRQQPQILELGAFYSLPPSRPQSKKFKKDERKWKEEKEENEKKLKEETQRLEEMSQLLGEGTPFTIATARASSIPSSPSSSTLDSTSIDHLLSLPCDSFYVWLPLGSSNMQMKAFRKTEPHIPDWICLCPKSVWIEGRMRMRMRTNPALPFETLTSLLPHCTRTRIADFHQRRTSSSSSSSASPSSKSLGLLLQHLYQLTDDRAGGPSVASSFLPSPPLLLRLAICPPQQVQRVFFVDCTMVELPHWYSESHALETLVASGVGSMIDITQDQRR